MMFDPLVVERDTIPSVLSAPQALANPHRNIVRSVAACAPLLVALICLLAPVSARAQEGSGDYRIGPKDLLEIRVLEITELNVERRVEDSGAIDLPLLGQFKVAGLTALEARSQLEDLLRAKYVNRANVSVVVKEFANKPITVVGAVNKPGSLTISGRFTLLQAISAASGLDASAGKKIYVLRRAENGLSDVLEVRTDDLFRGSTAMWNVPVFPSDVINIPARTTVKVFCLGEVKTPGALEFDSDDRLSLLSVIAKAGGLSDRASKTILVKRRGADGKDVEAKYNYKAVIAGKEPDPTLKADDVVVVQGSFF
jgi:polysaccharide export outer membrane protein